MIGKRVFTSLLSAVLTVSISASASAWNWDYKTSQRVLSVNGDAVVNEFLSLTVSPFGETIGENLTGAEKILIKTFQSTDGRVDGQMTLPSAWECGRYSLSYEDKVHHLLIANPLLSGAVSSATTKDAILNLLTEANGFKNGADTGQKEKVAQIMAKHVPDDGYDVNTFVRQYMILEGMIRFRENAITVNEYLEHYALYLKNEVAEEDKASFAQILSFYEGAPEKIIEEGMLLLSLRNGSKTNFQEKTLGYINSKGLSQGSYTSLNSFYVNELWDALYEDRESLTSFATLYNSFVADASAKYLLQQGSEDSFTGSTDTDSGSIGSSGGGGGGASKPNDNNKTDTDNEKTNGLFSDMNGHWAQTQVEKMAQQGIISGVGNGLFEPDRGVTRAEFAKMLVQMLGLKQEDTDAFTDVTADDWYSGFVGAAYRSGIIKGNDGLFRPDEFVSREDAAVMLHRFLEHRGIIVSGGTSFADNSLIADYATEAVSTLAQKGVITGYENRFRPKDTTSRAEAAVMIGRADALK